MADFTDDEITILKALAARPQKIISELELDENINGDELIPTEDGSATKNISVDDLKDYIEENFNLFATTSLAGLSYLSSPVKLANNTSDKNNDIDFSAGVFQFDDGSGQSVLSAMTKRLDATWAAGTNQGGLDTGSKANSTWYYCYAIYNPTTLVSDFLFSASATSPTLPSGYTKSKLLPYALRTDSSGNILAGKWYKDGTFVFASALLVLDLSGAGSGTVTNVMPTLPCRGDVQMVLSLTTTGHSNLGVYGNLQTVQTDVSFISTIGSNNGFEALGYGVVYADNGSISYKNFTTTGGVDNQDIRLLSYKILNI